MGHQVIKLQNPLKTLGFLQFYRFKTVKDRIIPYPAVFFHYEFLLINYFPNTSHHPNPFQNLICPPSTIHIRKFLPPKWHLPSVDFF